MIGICGWRKGRPFRLPGGSSLRFDGVDSQPALLMRQRHAPGTPWAVLASGLLAIGLALMWRRFL